MKAARPAVPALLFWAWPLVAVAQGPPDLVFKDGFDACPEAEKKHGSIGCEFWAADLDNAVEVVGIQGSFECLFVDGTTNGTMPVCVSATDQLAGLCDPPGNSCPAAYTCQTRAVCVLDAQSALFGILVANPQSYAVEVTVRAANGATFQQSVPAGGAAELRPQMNGIPDQSLDGTAIEKRAYKVTASGPVAAYQLNAADSASSRGASLLLPRATYGPEYRVMSWPTRDRRPEAHSLHGYLAVVAYTDDTVVEVTPESGVRASVSLVGIAAHTPTTFTLDAHDVLTLQAVPGGDLTGSWVRAVDGTTTFGVFGGHEAMGIGESEPPDPAHTFGPCCEDHTEEMMPPTSSWGRSFAVARSQGRGTNEPDILRVLAQKPNTAVTFHPLPTGACATLQPGEHCQVKIAADTAISATEPILVGHYLESALWGSAFGGSIGEGDPGLALAIPTEQYRTEYTVVVPAGYAKNFLAVSAPPAGAVLVDDVPITLTPFAGGTYRAARVPVGAGAHRVSCPGTCAVLVHGYGDAVGYMFPAGHDLEPIVIE